MSVFVNIRCQRSYYENYMQIEQVNVQKVNNISVIIFDNTSYDIRSFYYRKFLKGFATSCFLYLSVDTVLCYVKDFAILRISPDPITNSTKFYRLLEL